MVKKPTMLQAWDIVKSLKWICPITNAELLTMHNVVTKCLKREKLPQEFKNIFNYLLNCLDPESRKLILELCRESL